MRAEVLGYEIRTLNSHMFLMFLSALGGCVAV
jgi:hypothetical protein